jgi:hypothetical protein
MAIDGTHRQRFGAGFGEPGTNACKSGARAICPKGFAVFGRNEKHRCDLLQFDDDIIRVMAVDIGQRIVTGSAALAVGRIEQIDGLPVVGAKPCARIIILALHIEDDDRARPGQQVRNDDADAFARPGWGLDNDMLGAAKGQKAPALAAKDNTRTLAKSVAFDLAFTGEARRPVQRCAACPKRVDQTAQEQATADQSARHRANNTGVAAIIPDELRHFERVIGGGGQAEDEPADHAGNGERDEQPERHANQQSCRPAVRRRACLLGHNRSPSPEIRHRSFWFAPRHRPAS